MSDGTDSIVKLPGWLWAGLVIGVVVVFTGGLGTWVGATLWDNNKTLVDHEGRIRRVESDSIKIDGKLDKILEKIERIEARP